MGSESNTVPQAERLGLMCLRLIRQLPRDNPVRKEAEVLVVECGLCDLGHILRNDEHEANLRAITDPEAYRRCLKCGGEMAHYRLKGYKCLRCD